MTLVSLETDTLETMLPTPHEIQEEILLTEAHQDFILRSRETVEAILNGWDKRRLLIVGPCSIHDLDAALEYATHFRQLAEKVADQFFLVMRTYFEKPRTIKGWKGILYDPLLDGSHNLSKGVRDSRRLLVELAELGVPAGAELLEINTAHYYADLLTWGCIGARTCCSPPHRQLASSFNFPIGFKNSTDGNTENPIHGILSAKNPHVYLGMDSNGKLTRILTEGNSLCHVILRGGHQGPNYHSHAINETIKKCQQANIRDMLVVDCSHDNCEKQHHKQISVFNSVLQQIIDGNENIIGMMLESHLHQGSQSISSQLDYGVSITDPCLDWPTTERLILNAYEKLRVKNFCCSLQ